MNRGIDLAGQSFQNSKKRGNNQCDYQRKIGNKMHLDITIRSNVQIKGNQLSIDPGGTPVALSSQSPLVSARVNFEASFQAGKMVTFSKHSNKKT